MPANLTPQYYSAETKLRTAKTTEEKISINEELLSLVPKHKGTEKIQKDLKTKISKLKKLSQSKKKTKKELLYSVKKEGAGQIVIVGLPNSGKSTLLNALTNAKAKTGDYPFTTELPQPAMMPYEDILIQLVDTPPLTKEFSPGWLKELVKTADGVLVVFDSVYLAEGNFSEKIEEFMELLESSKINPPAGGKKIIIVGNKIDTSTTSPKGLSLSVNSEIANPWGYRRVDLLKENIGYKNILGVSALKGVGLEELKQEIFDILGIIRVYTKQRSKKADLSHPFTLPKGSKLFDLAQQIHFDLVEKFQYAKLFKGNSKKLRIVGRNYILEDRDIIEVHTQ